MERQTTPPDHPTDRPPTGGPPPPRDPFEEWAREQMPPPPPPRSGLDPTALFVLLDGLRRVVPRELDDQLSNLIREFLLTLRALIDWYLERLDRPSREPRVEDIPID
jgi:hypothetical protein